MIRKGKMCIVMPAYAALKQVHSAIEIRQVSFLIKDHQGFPAFFVS